MATMPRAKEMFSNAAGSVAIAEAFEDFKGALTKSLDRRAPLPGMYASEQSAVEQLQYALGAPDVVKALSPELIQSVEERLGNLNKDLTLTNPLSGGLVAYDLKIPSLKMFPRPTPLRNRIPRVKGVGTAHQFKRITGITGSGTGGLSNIHAGISSSPGGGQTQTPFGPVTFNRGAKIEYAGDDTTVPYKEHSLSDSVPFNAQFAGAGFEDLRSFSATSVLYSSMLVEEREIIAGRGTAAGFGGALGAPGSVSVTTPAASGSQVANTGALANVWVKVTAETIFGESTLSSAATSAWSSGDVILVSVDADVPGATGYRVYVSTHATADPGDAARYYAGRSTSNKILIQGALPSSGRTASLVTADTTGQTNGYDGMLSYAMGPNSGYRARVNGPFSSTNPGAEFFAAFAAMYQNNLADPDEVFFNGIDRKNISDRLKSVSNNPYRIIVNNSDEAHDATLGALVTGLQNEVTGKMVGITVHPWLPQGVAPIISWDLPIADSNVSNIWEIRGPQDYMSINWPVLQFSYDVSTYWYNSLICYAPAWQGCVSGIVAD